MDNRNSRLLGKVIITVTLEFITGMHIGGSDSALEIGGVKHSVIKTKDGKPYIPGSSTKGKLRSLLARSEGSNDVKEDSVKLQRIFGMPGDYGHDEKELKGGIGQQDGASRQASDDSNSADGLEGFTTRLIVRDAFLNEDWYSREVERSGGSVPLTEIKTENTINRITGAAINPRPIERVPAGTNFTLEMVYNVYDEIEMQEDISYICLALQMLKDDYLGGQGSRGYGKVQFDKPSFIFKSIDDYANETQGKELERFTI